MKRLCGKGLYVPQGELGRKMMQYRGFGDQLYHMEEKDGLPLDIGFGY